MPSTFPRADIVKVGSRVFLSLVRAIKRRSQVVQCNFGTESAPGSVILYDSFTEHRGSCT